MYYNTINLKLIIFFKHITLAISTRLHHLITTEWCVLLRILRWWYRRSMVTVHVQIQIH